MKFYVSLAATEATDNDGRPLIRGETVELNPEQREHPFNARLIAERQLISISQTDAAQEEAEETVEQSSGSGSSGRSSRRSAAGAANRSTSEGGAS